MTDKINSKLLYLAKKMLEARNALDSLGMMNAYGLSLEEEAEKIVRIRLASIELENAKKLLDDELSLYKKF